MCNIDNQNRAAHLLIEAIQSLAGNQISTTVGYPHTDEAMQSVDFPAKMVYNKVHSGTIVNLILWIRNISNNPRVQ